MGKITRYSIYCNFNSQCYYVLECKLDGKLILV